MPKVRKKRRGNSRYIVLFIVICLLVSLLIYGAGHLIRTMSFFNIRHIEIVGNRNLEASFLAELATEFIDTNLYSLSQRVLGYKYENIVRVKNMRMRRIPPNKLKLIFNERVGVAYLKTKEGYLVPIDEEMVILDRRGFFSSENLPIVETNISVDNLQAGETLEDERVEVTMTVHKLIQESRIDERLISEYFFRDDNLYLIEANTGSRICLGKDNYYDTLKKLQFVWENIGIVEQTELDLKFADRVIIRTGGKR